MNENLIVKKLIELLDNSVKKNCSGEDKIGIIFSGGIDSTIIAYLAKKYVEITAYTVGVKDSGDLKLVDNLNKEGVFDFKIKTKILTYRGVEKLIPKVLSIRSNTNPIQVSCAIPIYLASNTANDDGLNVVFMGQGGDEIFGGYNRYLNHANSEKKLYELMKNDVDNAYEDNLNRDIEMCRANGVELRLPYIDREFIEFSIGRIPINLKIKEIKKGEHLPYSCVDEVKELRGRRYIRKYILRKAAEKIGVPKEVIGRKKKALQYGSSSMKFIKKLAGERGFKGNNSITRYLEYIKKS